MTKVDLEVYRMKPSWDKIAEIGSVDLETYCPDDALAECMFVVRPHTEHFAFFLQASEFNRVSNAARFPLNAVDKLKMNWWKRGLPTKVNGSRRPRPVKIALLDAYHPALKTLPLIDQVHNHREVESSHAHGLHVAAVMTELAILFGLTRENVTIEFFAIDDPDIHSSETPCSHSTIANGIYDAVQASCDLVSVSAGSNNFQQDASDQVSAAVEFAEASGVPVFAAAGNNPDLGVAEPAAYRSCFAVAALCADLDAPDQTVSAWYVEQAKSSGKVALRTHDIIGMPETFLWHMSSWGDEVDIVAPGAPIFLTLDQKIHELAGTSFSCPVVAISVARLMLDIPKLAPLEHKAVKTILSNFPAFVAP